MDENEIKEGIRRMEELHRVAGYDSALYENSCTNPKYEHSTNPKHLSEDIPDSLLLVD